MRSMPEIRGNNPQTTLETIGPRCLFYVIADVPNLVQKLVESPFQA